MAIRATNAPEHGDKLQLVDCPLCGHSFDKREHRFRHFLQEHRPEDAGLSPLGTIPDRHDSPLAVTNPGEAIPEPDSRGAGEEVRVA